MGRTSCSLFGGPSCGPGRRVGLCPVRDLPGSWFIPFGMIQLPTKKGTRDAAHGRGAGLWRLYSYTEERGTLNSKLLFLIPLIQGIKQYDVLAIRLNFYCCDDLIWNNNFNLRNPFMTIFFNKHFSFFLLPKFLMSFYPNKILLKYSFDQQTLL